MRINFDSVWHCLFILVISIARETLAVVKREGEREREQLTDHFMHLSGHVHIQ